MNLHWASQSGNWEHVPGHLGGSWLLTPTLWIFKTKIRNNLPKPKLKDIHVSQIYVLKYNIIIYTYQMKWQEQLLLQGELWTKSSTLLNNQPFLQFFLLFPQYALYDLSIYMCLYIHVNSNSTYSNTQL